MIKKSIVVLIVIWFSISGYTADLIPYSTKGHPKSMGLNFQISFPADWKRVEGRHPHVVQGFEYAYDNHPVLGVVQIMQGDRDAYEDCKKSDASPLSEDDYRAILPTGATLISGTITNLDGEKAICLEYTMTQERNHLALKSHSLSYYIPFRDRVIIVFFAVGGQANDHGIDATFKKILPTFHQIVATTTITSKWE